jgi:protein ImuB
VSSLLSGSRRYLAVWFPLLPCDRVHRLRRRAGGTPDERPLVVLARVRGAQRIAHADRRALELGLRPGLTLADARARVPDLSIEDEDPAADHALIERIAGWCERYTPMVGLSTPDGLNLDITGCAHLFGGEAALRNDLRVRLARAGFSPRTALAGTPDAAAALARYSPGGVVPSGGEAAAVRPLPLAALGLDAERITALARAGLKTIADLADRPRAPIAARFGADILDRLVRTLGEVDSPISPRTPLPELAAERRFAEPIGRAGDVLGTLQQLAGDLASVLEARGEGGRIFEGAFFRADGAVRRIRVQTGQAMRGPDALARLFDERLDALADPIDPGFGFDMIRLSVLAAEVKAQSQTRLDGEEQTDERIAEAVDRLGARFNPAKVLRFVAHESHVPERAARALPYFSGPASEASWTGPQPDDPPLRPLRLFASPEPVEETLSEVPDGPPRRFRWRRVMHEVAHAEGPERIAPEWWKDEEGAATRDYFRVEDREGRRFWLYREGLYNAETGHPRWFVHGLFA